VPSTDNPANAAKSTEAPDGPIAAASATRISAGGQSSRFAAAARIASCKDFAAAMMAEPPITVEREL
jgi:hypothetical protein